MIVKFVTVFLLSVTSLRAEPCTEYRTLDEQKRSVLFSPPPTEANLCDNTLDESAWYRFDVLPPSRLHTECVPVRKCGTEHPIWMRGTLPTANDPQPIEAEACSPNADGSDCCGYFKEKIKVKFCPRRATEGEDYYVYQLKKAPRCDMAYCAGDQAICPNDQIFNQNSRSCTERHPNIAAPLFRGKEEVTKTMTGTGTQYVDFCFVCEIRRQSADPEGIRKGQRFEVTFTFDGKESPLVKPKVVDGSDLRVKLWSHELYNNLGKSVGCQVRSFWNRAERHKSDYIAASDTFFVGIRYSLDNKIFNSPRIEIDEKDPPLTIYFKPTVPVSCPENDPASTCQFTVNVHKDDRLKTSSCTMLFSAFVKPESIGELKFQPIPTPGQNPRTFVIRFDSVVKDDKYFWHNYNLTDITISVKDTTKPSICTSWGDPHFITFDGKTYDDFQEGDYVFAKSTAGRNFEVHVRHHKCSSVTCNCAVVVREGNNVLGINACQRPRFTPTLVTFLRDRNVPGASITSVGNRYTIKMPSGAYIIADWTLWSDSMYFNIYLHSTSADRGKMLGLCGDNNGNPNDDTKINGTSTVVQGQQPREFVKSYRLKPEESFINGHVHKIRCLDIDKLLPTICKCDEGNIINCADPQNSRQTFITQYTNNCNKPDVDIQRRRRQAKGNPVTDDSDMMLTVADMPMPVFNETVERNYTWPTPKGITETQAKEHCERELRKSPVYQDCVDMMTGKMEHIISGCVTDIQITDDVEMAVSNVISEYQSNCIFNMETSIVKEDNDTSPPTPAEIQMANVMSKICPAQCNGKGSCNNGNCQCNDGFGGEDCSINTRQPPQLLQFRKSAICDMQKSPCTMTSILASNFMQSSKLGCRVSAVDQSKSFNLGASLMSSMEVICQLPVVNRHLNASAGKTRADIKQSGVYHWDISLTSDGNQHSNALRMVVYDSKCQECNADGACRKISDECNYSFGNSIYAINYFIQFAVICFGLLGRFVY